MADAADGADGMFGTRWSTHGKEQDSTADSDLPKGVGIPKQPAADDDVEEKGKKQSEYWSRARMPRSLK